MAEQLPKKLGPYQILAYLGGGGMGDIYKAYHPGMDREVAIKVLLPHLARREEVRTRFLREVRTIAKLEHRYILSVYDFGEDKKKRPYLPYLVMRYIKDGTMADLLRARRLSSEAGIALVAQTAEALAYAHGQGIVHRDIKPSNVLIGRDGEALLSDFGIAKVRDESLQLTSGIIGTPHYMAPEVLKGQPADGRADIYALGVMLFEVVTGRLPFMGATPLSIAMMHINDPLPRIQELNAAVSPILVAVTERALAKDPAQRFQTAGELAGTLHTALRDTVSWLAPGLGPQVASSSGAEVAAPPAPVAVPAAGLTDTLIMAAPPALVAAGALESSPPTAHEDEKARADAPEVEARNGGVPAHQDAHPTGLNASVTTGPEPTLAGSPTDPDEAALASPSAPAYVEAPSDPSAGRPTVYPAPLAALAEDGSDAARLFHTAEPNYPSASAPHDPTSLDQPASADVAVSTAGPDEPLIAARTDGLAVSLRLDAQAGEMCADEQAPDMISAAPGVADASVGASLGAAAFVEVTPVDGTGGPTGGTEPARMDTTAATRKGELLSPLPNESQRQREGQGETATSSPTISHDDQGLAQPREAIPMPFGQPTELDFDETRLDPQVATAKASWSPRRVAIVSGLGLVLCAFAFMLVSRRANGAAELPTATPSQVATSVSATTTVRLSPTTLLPMATTQPSSTRSPSTTKTSTSPSEPVPSTTQTPAETSVPAVGPTQRPTNRPTIKPQPTRTRVPPTEPPAATAEPFVPTEPPAATVEPAVPVDTEVPVVPTSTQVPVVPTDTVEIVRPTSPPAHTAEPPSKTPKPDPPTWTPKPVATWTPKPS